MNARRFPLEGETYAKLFAFVIAAAQRALNMGDGRLTTKTEAGVASHIGQTDLDNTSLAQKIFGQGCFLVIEEDLPAFKTWHGFTELGANTLFVDPLDGTYPHGTGSSGFAVAACLYAPDGTPLIAAAASPGIRPVFRLPNGTLGGFPQAMGTYLIGTPHGVILQPMFGEGTGTSLIVPPVTAVQPTDHRYTAVIHDCNARTACGIGAVINQGVGGSMMGFSNIMAQMQVILGQAGATHLGPHTAPPEGDRSGLGIVGPKAWDLLLPLLGGVGLGCTTLATGAPVIQLTPDLCLESWVLRERLVISHPHTAAAHADIIRQALLLQR